MSSSKSSLGFLTKRVNSLTAVVFFVISFGYQEALDLAIGATYYVIPRWYLFVFIGLVYLMFGGIQWGLERFKKPISTIVVWSHYAITTSMVCTVLFTNASYLVNELIYLTFAMQVVYVLAVLFSIVSILRKTV